MLRIIGKSGAHYNEVCKMCEDWGFLSFQLPLTHEKVIVNKARIKIILGFGIFLFLTAKCFLLSAKELLGILMKISGEKKSFYFKSRLCTFQKVVQLFYSS